MRYAIISDIHANEDSLRSVLADARDAGVDKIVCLGDVLGYGPDPVSVLELVFERVDVCLMGNHDAAVANLMSVEDFTDFAADAVVRQRKSLRPEALRWLRTLKYEWADNSIACTHGDFSDPKGFNYVIEPEESVPSFGIRTEQLMFVGHSHEPCIFVLGQSGVPHKIEPQGFILEEGKRYLVNPGSVGYPRNKAGRSSYCIWDDVTRSVEFKTLPFDLESYRLKMNNKGLDEAPWMLAREESRRRPVVRSAMRFGKDPTPERTVPTSERTVPTPGRTVPTPERTVPIPGGTVPTPERTVPILGGTVPISWRTVPGRWVTMTVCAIIAILCVILKFSLSPSGDSPRFGGDSPLRAGGDSPRNGRDEDVDGDDEHGGVSAPIAIGGELKSRQGTVPAGVDNMVFSVKLKRGGDPVTVWVRVYFIGADNMQVGVDKWYPDVKLSKRGTVPVPEGATSMRVVVMSAKNGDVREVDSIEMKPKDRTKDNFGKVK